MKSEQTKMLSGELYNASDPRLSQERQKARNLLHQLNVTGYGDPSAYKKIVSSLLPNAAEDITIEPPFFCDYGYNIYTDTKVYFNFNCVVLDVMPVRIASNVLFGPSVQLYTATHPLEAVERRRGYEFGKPISIGQDCWIGGGAIVCAGVTIGEGAVVGAGAVVVKDIPPHTIVAGNPAGPLNPG